MRLCACGCGKPLTRHDRNYLLYHRYGRGNHDDFDRLDQRFVAYWTGAAHARNGQPANPGDFSTTYMRGYNYVKVQLMLTKLGL